MISEEAIIQALQDAKGSIGAAEIAKTIDEHPQAVGKQMARMAQSRKIIRTSPDGEPRVYTLRNKLRKPNHKRKARELVKDAIRTGKLIRPEQCSECNEPGFIYAHHPDYSRPLDIEWLCKPCHHKRHPNLPAVWFIPNVA